jgi:uncharacterized circularly permuted ATP-grasp superfamily protein/uncharacterized alpha-E superfamily protein
MSEDLLDHYRVPGTAYDELRTPTGELRPQWTGLIETLRGLGAAGVRQRVEASRRLVQERGIQFLAPEAEPGAGPGWDLDPVPLLIAPEDWERLERGLIQRARLLNAILRDCYGPQQLIHSQWLPPALVFGQSRFLRPCHGVEPPGGVFLHSYAVDVGRGPDGGWWVLSDRTQVPAGAGYTLANRLIASRVFPTAFRAQPVHRLAGFFQERRMSLAGMALQPGRDAHVVLLSPGVKHEAYFEHSYLARYMGYPLVEGQDLAVRDDRVFLKTLSGLEPVDVLIRRVKDDFCDPLELRNDSIQCIPGLLEAVRAGNITIANALGSGLAEAPAFLGFLPGLCRHLLGEELRVPSVATWWCGQPDVVRHVLEKLPSLSVQDAFRVRPNLTEFEGVLTAEKLAELRERIRFQPTRFVARDRLELSHAPAWDGARLVARPVTLRVFLVASGDTYRVMRGGLARVAPEPAVHSVTMRQNWTSKDVWVVSAQAVEQVSLLQPADQSVELRRVGNNLPSRLADDFFWLGRYVERAGATARLLRSLLIRLTPEGVPEQQSLLAPLIEVLESEGQLPPGQARNTFETLEADLRAAIFDPHRPGSLRGIAGQLVRLGLLVRDRTSNDVWRALSQIEAPFIEAGPPGLLLAGDLVHLLNSLLLNLAALHGLARENMTRAQGWRFLDMGCRVERALALASFLTCSLRSPEADNPSALELVLEVADSSITYRSRYSVLPNLAAVYDLVLLDDTNPRALRFQFDQLLKHYERLPRVLESALPDPAQRLLIECAARLRLLDPRELNELDGRLGQSDTARVLRHVLRSLPKFSNALAAAYFAHSSLSRTGRIL